jgi:UDP-GlcNAc:undecaprenyl-phosphate/decaprenyl-phosphate GlcNAc-1-phosphate transferase
MRSLDTWDAVLAFVFAGSVAWCLVPSAEAIARRIGPRAIDFPKERGLHDVPTPKLGGLAILVAVLGAGLIWLPWDAETRSILAGAVVITALGVADDIFDLPALPKLLGQIGAALIPVVLGDVRVDVTTLPFVGGYELGWLSYPLTVIGIVAVINIINFIDGVDGLASGVCAISAAAFAVIAISLDRYEAGVLAAITAGASLGFLRHGFPPASSFMGDTGSNLLGFLLATVAVQGSLKTNAALALALPLLVLAVPILDTSFVVAKRLKYRQPIYQADRSHFHHRLANIGFSQRRTLKYLYGWTFVLAGVALALRFIPYSDDRGNFDPFWTVVIVLLLLGAMVTSVYVIYMLEILKLRRFRLRQRGPGAEPGAEHEVDEGVKRELDTGEFAAVNPESGELSAVDRDSGELERVPRAGAEEEQGEQERRGEDEGGGPPPPNIG